MWISQLFPQKTVLILTPERFYLFAKKRHGASKSKKLKHQNTSKSDIKRPCDSTSEMLVFDHIEDVVAHLSQRSGTIEIFLDGFEKIILTEALPSLKEFEKRSYLKHKSLFFLEEVPLVFMARHSETSTFIGEEWELPVIFYPLMDRLKSVRPLAFDIAKALEAPTLLYLPLLEGGGRLFYIANQTLLFARTIKNDEQDYYEKTVRYIERHFHQSAATLQHLNGTLEDLWGLLLGGTPGLGTVFERTAGTPLENLKTFFLQKCQSGLGAWKSPTIKMMTRSKKSFSRFYLMRLGLQGITILLACFLWTLGGDFYQNWHLKEGLQRDLFALRKTQSHDLQRRSIPSGKFSQEMELQTAQEFDPRSEKFLDDFKALLDTRVNPLDDLRLLVPINVPQMQLQGLVWRHQKDILHTEKASHKYQNPLTQITLQVCSAQPSVNDLESMIRNALRSLKSPFVHIHIRESSDQEESLEAGDTKEQENCRVVDIQKQKKS